jgi:leucyl/phenylalanyl-tRNA--protein transferase
VNNVLWLDPDDELTPFPHVSEALRDPDGLLAVGGKLCQRRLLAAYRNGIFPWYSTGQPVLWWSPDPRTVLVPEQIRINRSLKKTLRQGHFVVTMDCHFAGVIDACAEPRHKQAGTWITHEMRTAYLEFHRGGHAHSLEVYQGDDLVGGLYGVAVGGVFFGESMFSRASSASKVALVALCAQLQAWNFALIDCQTRSEHLFNMGAKEISRDAFMASLDEGRRRPGQAAPWELDRQLVGEFVKDAKGSLP